MAAADSLSFVFSWDRESTYGAMETPTYNALCEDPDSVIHNF